MRKGEQVWERATTSAAAAITNEHMSWLVRRKKSSSTECFTYVWYLCKRCSRYGIGTWLVRFQLIHRNPIRSFVWNKVNCCYYYFFGVFNSDINDVFSGLNNRLHSLYRQTLTRTKCEWFFICLGFVFSWVWLVRLKAYVCKHVNGSMTNTQRIVNKEVSD